MHTFIIVVHVLVAVILVLTVLLQAGKGSGMGAAFGGSSSSLFGTRGPATLVSKVTCAAAIIFMCTSLNLAIYKGGKGGSVMEKWETGQTVGNSPAAVPAADGRQTPATDENPASAGTISNEAPASETILAPAGGSAPANKEAAAAGSEGSPSAGN